MRTLLEHGAYPNYIAAWDPTTEQWSIDFAPNPHDARGHRTVIKISALDNRDGDVEARFLTLDPKLKPEDAAKYAATAIMEFFWPEPEDDRDVNTVVMVNDADGARYEFEAPE